MFDEVMPNMRVLNQVGYMTQASALYEELTIRENINFLRLSMVGLIPNGLRKSCNGWT